MKKKVSWAVRGGCDGGKGDSSDLKTTTLEEERGIIHCLVNF